MKSYADHYRVEPGEPVNLGKIDAGAVKGVKDKAEGKELLATNIERLAGLQYTLYAENRRSLLVVLQGMDTAGKDGTIRHVMTGVNPQGCKIHSFKAPSANELDRDFLWRIHQRVPPRGEIGIFNRSHYEDVLVVRVHSIVPKKIWAKRYEQINRFERNLAESGTTILKFFIYIDKDEQKERLQARLDEPDKNWKFNSGDLEERKMWGDYIGAYEEALKRCSKPWAPWFVIPANRKWYRNLVVSDIIAETLEKMDLKMPKADFDPKSIVIE